MAITPNSTGTYNFSSIQASDLLIEAFERTMWRAPSLTPDMLLSGQRSLNMVQSRWSNLGVNLWEVSQQTLTLVQGQPNYTLPATTIDVLPSQVIRQWNLSNQTNLSAPLTTALGSTSILVTQPSHGLSVGVYINVATPVAVGGIVISGFYPVVSVPSTNTYTITAAIPALSASSSNSVPLFTTDGSTGNVTVGLTNQPFLPGQTFNVEVPVTVGGLVLSGSYLILSVATNSFVIQSQQVSTSAVTVSMNGGLAQIQSQPATQSPYDRVLYPMSRADYTALSNKFQQGTPTSFWFDRTIVPSLTFWPVPDANGPYEFVFYVNSQMQDASMSGGAQINIPYRFIEAFTAALAAHLAIKWRPEMATILEQYSRQVWQEASDADVEKVSFYVSPDFSGYFS